MSNNTIWDDTVPDWILLIKHGNQQAFGKLYDKYAPMMMGVIMRLVGDREIAENVLLQVFGKIWDLRSGADFSKERLFSSLLKIARDTAIEVNPAAKTNFSDTCDQGKRPETDSFTRVISGQLKQGNPDLLFGLEKTAKKALELIYFKGWNFEETAVILGIPVEILKEKVKKAIKQLKEVAM